MYNISPDEIQRNIPDGVFKSVIDNSIKKGHLPENFLTECMTFDTRDHVFSRREIYLKISDERFEKLKEIMNEFDISKDDETFKKEVLSHIRALFSYRYTLNEKTIKIEGSRRAAPSIKRLSAELMRNYELLRVAEENLFDIIEENLRDFIHSSEKYLGYYNENYDVDEFGFSFRSNHGRVGIFTRVHSENIDPEEFIRNIKKTRYLSKMQNSEREYYNNIGLSSNNFVFVTYPNKKQFQKKGVNLRETFEFKSNFLGQKTILHSESSRGMVYNYNERQTQVKFTYPGVYSYGYKLNGLLGNDLGKISGGFYTSILKQLRQDTITDENGEEMLQDFKNSIRNRLSEYDYTLSNTFSTLINERINTFDDLVNNVERLYIDSMGLSPIETKTIFYDFLQASNRFLNKNRDILEIARDMIINFDDEFIPIARDLFRVLVISSRDTTFDVKKSCIAELFVKNITGENLTPLTSLIAFNILDGTVRKILI